MRVIRTFVLVVVAVTYVQAQTSRQLLGKVVKGDDQSQTPVTAAKVVLDESGSEFEIKPGDNGLFHVFLPDIFRPGQEVTISVSVPGYAVYEPPGGKVRVPDDLARTRVKIQLLAKGSPKFLSDAQLRALVQGAANESVRRPATADAKERPDPARYLREWAAQYGFTVDQVRAELDRWAAEAGSGKADPYELALKAFALQNFHEANQQALSAATEAETELAKAQEQQQELTDRAIKGYILAGDAAYNDFKFEDAATAYDKALAHATRDRDPRRWAALQIRIGASQEGLISRSEGTAISGHAHAAIGAYNLALEVYNRDSAPQDWAATQNNLGVALWDLAGRSEGPQAAEYLKQAVEAYNKALQVYTREQLPQEWAATQNNLGIALRDLAGRSEGPQAAEYLKQAVEAYNKALQVRTREQLPQDWAATQNNLGVALWDLAGRSAGPQAAEYLKQAVEAYHKALQVRTREQLPQGWATTQNNLGATLDDLAGRSEGPQAAEYLKQAVEAYNKALQVRTREQLPQDWAATQNNLGATLDDLAGRSEGPQAAEYLKQAVEAYNKALQVRDPRATAPGLGDDAEQSGPCPQRPGGAERRAAGSGISEAGGGGLQQGLAGED